MPKKESVKAKRIIASSSEDSDYDVAPKASNAGGMREVNRDNILNYQSDSSDDNQDDSSDEELNVPKYPKPKAMAEVSSSTPWGSSKKSFYAAAGKGEAGSDDNMSSSEAEEDQRLEAERLA